MIPLLVAVATAATPNPDRPSVSRSGFLIAENSLELEVGAQWQGARTAPTLLKYSIAGIVEPRIGLDLSGIDGGTPAMTAGVKIRFVDSGTVGLSGYLDSVIPVSGEESWFGTAAVLFTLSDEGWTLQANGGVSLHEPPLDLRAVQLAVAGGRQLTNAFSTYVEVAVDPGPAGLAAFIVDGGLGWSLTDSLILDGAIGWDFANESVYGAAGLTVNFGALSGLP